MGTNIIVQEEKSRLKRTEYSTYKDLFDELDKTWGFSKDKIEVRKEYLQIRKGYNDSADYSSRRFDTTLISLGVGALGGSMYFINQRIVVENKQIFLFASICLGISIGLTLFSFFLSEESNILTMVNYDNIYRKQKNIGSKEYLEEIINIDEKKIYCYNQKILLIKWLSMGLLSLGIGLLITFLYSNIQ